jgi:hypothetical protein
MLPASTRAVSLHVTTRAENADERSRRASMPSRGIMSEAMLVRRLMHSAFDETRSRQWVGFVMLLAGACGPRVGPAVDGAGTGDGSSTEDDMADASGMATSGATQATSESDGDSGDEDDEVQRCEIADRTDPFWVRGLGTEGDADLYTLVVAPGLDGEVVWLGSLRGVVDLGCGPLGADEEHRYAIGLLDRFGNLLWTRMLDSVDAEIRVGTDANGHIHLFAMSYDLVDDAFQSGVVLVRLDRDGTELFRNWYPGSDCHHLSMGVRPSGDLAVALSCDHVDFGIGSLGEPTWYPHTYQAGVLFVGPDGEAKHLHALAGEWGTYVSGIAWTPGGDLVLSSGAPHTAQVLDDLDVEIVRGVERWRPSDDTVLWRREGRAGGLEAGSDVLGLGDLDDEYDSHVVFRLRHVDGSTMWAHPSYVGGNPPSLSVDGLASGPAQSTILLGTLSGTAELASVELQSSAEWEVLLAWFDSTGEMLDHELWGGAGYRWSTSFYAESDDVLVIGGGYHGSVETPDAHAAAPCNGGELAECAFVARVQH